MKKWYAVYTRPFSEKKVAAVLKKKGLSYFLPVTVTTNSPTEGGKKKEQPLFPSWVFVKLTKMQQEEVSKINGVLSYLHWIDEHATFADTEINLIVQFLGAHDTVSVQNVPVKAEAARVIEIAKGDEKILQLTLPSLGYILSASLPQIKLVRQDLFIQTTTSKSHLITPTN